MGNRITRIIRGRRVHPIALHDDLLEDNPALVVNNDDEDVETDSVMERSDDEEEPNNDEVTNYLFICLYSFIYFLFID